MPTDRTPPATAQRHDDALAARAAQRLALGTAVAIAISVTLDWSFAFVCPVVAAALLALPMPLSVRAGLGFLVATAIALAIGLVVFIPLLQYPLPCLIVIGLALYWIARRTFELGATVMRSFMLMAVTVVPLMGTQSPALAIAFAAGFLQSVCAALLVVWLAQALLPGHSTPPITPRAEPEAEPEGEPEAQAGTAPRTFDAGALIGTLAIWPAIVWFLAHGQTSYGAAMMKLAQLAHQARPEDGRRFATLMLLSTALGGTGAVVVYALLKPVPSVVVYVLLVAIAALVFGRRIFAGGAGAPMWSSAFVTLLLILGPSVNAGPTGDEADTKFLVRLLSFLAVTLYMALALRLLGAFGLGVTGRTANAVASTAR
jgi:hypothetical protein